MANIFYETKKFDIVEPEFFQDIRTECVNDSMFYKQWNLRNTGQNYFSNGDVDIHFCDAHSVTTGNNSTIIAVYDRGVDSLHQDLNIHSFSYDAQTNSSPGKIYHYHGTGCAGIIGAKTNNNKGIAGIAPDCPVMSISFDTHIGQYNIGHGFRVAADNGCSVISNSWNCLYPSSYIDEGITYALSQGRNGKGSVVVFSAGNEDRDSINYPANSNADIIVVGAMSPCGERCSPYSCDAETTWGSNYGVLLDVMAPGVTIPTTDISGSAGANTSNYMDNFNGTSSACPHVAAVAGLILSVNPNLTQKEVADIIESTAQKIGLYYNNEPSRPNGTWSTFFGYGLVDAFAAVSEAKWRYDQYIVGPNYVCDTTMYCLIHPSAQDETVTWSVHNGQWMYPHYSIVGENGHDTVYVRCERMSVLPDDPLHPDYLNAGGFIFPLDTIQSLSVTINNGETSEKYTKVFRSPVGQTPEISASNSNTNWLSGTSRTFTISNCTSTPDAALSWEIKKITMHLDAPDDTVITTTTGRSVTYTAFTPLRSLCRVYVTATNTQMECEPQSVTNAYVVIRKILLLGNVESGQLNVSIYEEDDKRSTSLTLADICAEDGYLLELQHNIYGRMASQNVQSAKERINSSQLPSGVYVLLLKDARGEVVAQTKVIIH